MIEDYIDHVAICTNTDVVLRTNKRTIVGPLSMRVRELPDERYGFFAHVGYCLIESFHGPLKEIQAAHDRVAARQQELGDKVTWRQDG